MRLKREKSDDIWNELQPYFGKEFALMFGSFFLIKAIFTYSNRPEKI